MDNVYPWANTTVMGASVGPASRTASGTPSLAATIDPRSTPSSHMSSPAHGSLARRPGRSVPTEPRVAAPSALSPAARPPGVRICSATASTSSGSPPSTSGGLTSTGASVEEVDGRRGNLSRGQPRRPEGLSSWPSCSTCGSVPAMSHTPGRPGGMAPPQHVVPGRPTAHGRDDLVVDRAQLVGPLGGRGATAGALTEQHGRIPRPDGPVRLGPQVDDELIHTDTAHVRVA